MRKWICFTFIALLALTITVQAAVVDAVYTRDVFHFDFTRTDAFEVSNVTSTSFDGTLLVNGAASANVTGATISGRDISYVASSIVDPNYTVNYIGKTGLAFAAQWTLPNWAPFAYGTCVYLADDDNTTGVGTYVFHSLNRDMTAFGSGTFQITSIDLETGDFVGNYLTWDGGIWTDAVTGNLGYTNNNGGTINMSTSGGLSTYGKWGRGMAGTWIDSNGAKGTFLDTVPEPSSLSACAIGIFGAFAALRRRK